jgi:beta-xylosidase
MGKKPGPSYPGPMKREPLNRDPLVRHIYTADPSAHVIGDRLYVFPSHDRDIDTVDNDNGDQYDMNDYHVLELDSMDGPARDLGVVLKLDDVPWASKQLWAPDAAWVNDRLYFYFPARDHDGVFRIGVATAPGPQGPYQANPLPIEGTFSIDPCVFVDDDRSAYLTFGGLWGGQLEKWTTGRYNPEGQGPAPDQPALCPKIALLAPSMDALAEAPRDLVITDAHGKPLLAGDEDRRYFEGPWMHKRGDLYYFSYSTGTTHKIVYATSKSPYGPFEWRGTILPPVLGWTTHHSIVEFKGRWWLFYHDCSLSGGVNHKRSVKVAPLDYGPDGSILPVEP